MSNNDLSDFKFRNNNGVAEFSIDNGTTWQKIGGGGMPALDFANPLFDFTTGTSYTATQECYLYGTSNSNSDMSVDGKIMFRSSTASYTAIPLTKIAQGQVITATANMTNVRVYKALS